MEPTEEQNNEGRPPWIPRAPIEQISSTYLPPPTPSIISRLGGALVSTAASAAAAAVGVATGGVGLSSPYAAQSSSVDMRPAPPTTGLAGRRYQSTTLREGIIDKWTNYLGAWRARYFIVEPGILKYANAPGQHIKETFPLMLCSIRHCPGDPFRLEVEHPHGILYLKMQTYLEKREWLSAMIKAKQIFQSQIAGRQRPSTTPAKSSSPTGSGEVALENVQDLEPRDDNESLSDFGDEKSPMDQLMESCANCRASIQTAVSEVRRLQAETLRLAGRVRDQQVRDDSKNLALRVVERLDLLGIIISRHLMAAETLAMAERNQRRQLEKSLRTMAKRNYRMKVRVQKLRRLLTEGKPAVMTTSSKDDDIEIAVPAPSLELATSEREQMRTLLTTAFSEEEEDEESSTENEEAREVLSESEEDEFFDAEEAGEQPPLYSAQQIDQQSTSIKRRTELPKPRTELRVSLWSILKDCIGKDLSRISMPVYFNEPTSFLQRLAEDFQYVSLLKEAVRHSDAAERLLWVSIFTLSPCASTIGRTYKPFNPLLGETFELSHRGFKFLAEQVGHHPPVTAYNATADEFEAWGHLVVKNRFTGKSLEVTLPGAANISLNLKGDVAKTAGVEVEHITLQRAKAIVNNVIFGKLSLEMFGPVVITSHSCGSCAFIEYLRQGWWSREMHVIRGVIFDPSGAARYRLGGWWSREIWVEALSPGQYILEDASQVRPIPSEFSAPPLQTSPRDGIIDAPSPVPKPKFFCRDPQDFKINWDSLESDSRTRRVVWRPDPRPPTAHRYYEFSQTTMELNDLSADYDRAQGACMPPTDSRYRPDQRWLEHGEINKANDEKNRLEEKQRAAARLRLRGEDDYLPRWFAQSTDPVLKETCWVSNREYWEAKNSGVFENCMEIF